MSSRVGRRALAALTSLVVAGGIAVALPTSAEAVTYRAYGASTYGTSAKFGNVLTLGRTANQPMCTTRPGITRTNTTASSDLKALGFVGAQNTKVQSVQNGSTQSTIATSTTAGLNLLSGLITATTIEAKATVTKTTSGYTQTGSTKLVGLKVAGVPVTANPAKNTKITLPLNLGTLIINEQGTTKTFGNYTQGTNGLRLLLNPNASLSLPSGQLVVSYALASLHEPTHARPYGNAYATQVKVGNVLSSGPSALVDLPCGGTSSATRTNNIAGLDLPGNLLDIGAASTTAKSVDGASATSAITTAQIAGINLLDGLITADAITSRAHTTRRGSTITRSSEGSSLTNLEIDGKPVLNIKANTKIALPGGLGTVYLRRSVWDDNGFTVTALRLELLKDQGTLKAGTVVEVGVAQSGVSAR
jgi:hypothetical protein